MKKTIAILLAFVMLLGCLSVAAVSAAETTVPGSVIITNDGINYTANKGAIIIYRVYATTPEVVENGQFYITYPQNLLTVNDYNVPNTPGYMINYDENLVDEIRFNFSNINGCDLTTEKLLIEVMFEVVGEGNGSIGFHAQVMSNLKDQPVVSQTIFRETIDDADVYKPTEIPQETTESSDTSSQPTDDPQPTTEPGEPSTAEPGEPTTAPSTPAPSTPATTAPPADNVGKGASGAAVESAITQAKNDSDPKGSTFNLLQVKNTKTTKKAIKISYKKPSGTKKFWIFAAQCGKPYSKVKETTAKSFNYKGLKKGVYYKFIVVALDKNDKVVATSKTIHVATSGGKFTNPKKVTITNASKAKSVKKGTKLKLTTKVTAQSKKLKLKNHRPVKFESAKPSVVKVTANGKITAKKSGSATIYAYAQNGVMAKVQVKVK